MSPLETWADIELATSFFSVVSLFLMHVHNDPIRVSHILLPINW